MLSTREIIEGCIKEDKNSQVVLYNTYSKKMLGVCYRYATDIMEAEDMLQEGFIKVFDNIAKYNFKGSFEGWIRRIMVNNAINKIRAKKLNLKYTDEYNCDIEYEITEDTLDEINHTELLKLIDKLPIGYKMVFNMYAVDGYSHREISKKLNIKESTSRSQFHKGKKCLLGLIHKKNK